VTSEGPAANFGEWVKTVRESSGMLQAELAQKMGFGPPYLSQIEGGSRPPTEAFCVALAQALGFSTDHVLYQAGLIASEGIDDETKDPDVQEFRRRIAQIADPDERERALEDVWALLDIAQRRSARRQDDPQKSHGRTPRPKGRAAAAD
jgi:transcriptional regulator with XRE-family HTH domain